MSVLLSIKPKYVEEMMNGNKKYEFRKVVWKRENLKKVYVYSSAPVKKIIGIFYVGDIIEDSPEYLWSEFKDHSGIAEEEFFNYFKKHNTGFAIEIDRLELFDKPIDPFEMFSDFYPPQSYYYIDENFLLQ